MQICTLIISSKNHASLKNFTKFFNKNNNKNFSFIKKLFKKPYKKKIITILKSPHVNKKAQEQFEMKQYFLQFSIKTTQIFKFLIFINKIKKFIVSDISIKIQIFNLKKKKLLINKKLFFINNFRVDSMVKKNFTYQLNKLEKIRFYNKTLYSIKNSNNFISNNLLKLFDIYGN